MKRTIISKKNRVKLLIAVLSLTAFQIKAQTYTEVAKRTAFDPITNLSDRELNGRYGASAVSADNNFAVIGSYNADVVSSGVTYANAGAVYVLQKVSGTWQTVQKLVANDPEQAAHFGSSVAIHEDYIIVGAILGEHSTGSGQNHGTVYIFEYNGSTWNQTVKLESPSPNPGNAVYFGHGVDIYKSNTGVFAVVGEPRSYPNGKTFVFERISSTNWQLNSTLTDGTSTVPGKNQYFGQSVAIHKDYLVVGASNGFVVGSSPDYGGLAYVFQYNGTDWNTIPEYRLVAGDQAKGDQFGNAVDITDDQIIVGAFYEKSPNAPSVSTGSGAAYIFKRDVSLTNSWSTQNKLTTPQRTGSELFGHSVSITPNFALVGAPNDRFDFCGTVINQTGISYLYRNDPQSVWPFVEEFRASDATISDHFGSGAAISGTATDPTFFVGAQLEDHDDNGNNFIDKSGSVYIYETPSTLRINNSNSFLNEEIQNLTDEINSDLYDLNDNLYFTPKAEIEFDLVNDNNLITIKVEENLVDQNREMVVELINTNGQILYSQLVESNNSATINGEGFAKGIYLVSIVVGDSRTTKKLLIE